MPDTHCDQHVLTSAQAILRCCRAFHWAADLHEPATHGFPKAPVLPPQCQAQSKFRALGVEKCGVVVQVLLRSCQHLIWWDQICFTMGAMGTMTKQVLCHRVILCSKTFRDSMPCGRAFLEHCKMQAHSPPSGHVHTRAGANPLPGAAAYYGQEAMSRYEYLWLMYCRCKRCGRSTNLKEVAGWSTNIYAGLYDIDY